MKIAFYTLGCKANQFETQALERLFAERGHEIVPFDGFADVYVVNTCTVTALSDKKSRNAARRCKKCNPAARLVLCGCYAQVKPQEARALCGADAVIGTPDKSRVVSIVEELAPDGVRDLWHEAPPLFDVLPAGGLSGRTRALLKVQDGCRNFCTYCLIPFARGPERSMPFDTAVSEARRLAEEGYREIVLTGIEISAYGRDLPGRPGLISLIEALCQAAPGCRIRLGSLEPRTVTEDFARRCAALPNLCPHFHLSLQSGCDRTLRAMNRHYTAGEYKAACELLRRYLPGCGLTTDLIVGFPGETREDFEESLRFVTECGLGKVHVFPYSRRQGTRAASMPGQLSQAEKAARSQQAIRVCRALEQKDLEARVGQTYDVLFEQQEDGWFTGHIPEYCLVKARGEGLHNRVLPVKITGCEEETLVGEVLA
ncbi:MAG: tRNA (N(6)-L-threonylcarbamoyladenosine(37)-C(2))-methylthiotransferase MtaB [Clostridiaceae bacterium]|nr:tRNA (N(6)-L-threonylcarbamoyladenosine(37)-C(2))-methylthiotransferase MtaB [Clostridiaceae bacterium]